MTTRFVQPTQYGGSGDGTLTVGVEDDTLSGDGFDDGSTSPARILTLKVPAADEGDDGLFGFDGGGADFWADYGNAVLDTTGLDETKAIVEGLGAEALEKARGGIAGTALLVGLPDGLGVLAQTAIDFLERLLETPTPKPIQEDVLNVKDIDPRKGVLVVPTNKNFTLVQHAGPMSFRSNGVDLSGVGLEFSIGVGLSKTVDARIFIDPEYDEAFGGENDTTGSEEVLGNVLDTKFTVSPGGPAKPDERYALYPNPSRAAKRALKASASTQFQVLGAFSPLFISDPDEKTFAPSTN